jgi:hypothetical protein
VDTEKNAHTVEVLVKMEIEVVENVVHLMAVANASHMVEANVNHMVAVHAKAANASHMEGLVKEVSVNLMVEVLAKAENVNHTVAENADLLVVLTKVENVDLSVVQMKVENAVHLIAKVEAKSQLLEEIMKAENVEIVSLNRE